MSHGRVAEAGKRHNDVWFDVIVIEESKQNVRLLIYKCVQGCVHVLGITARRHF